MILTDDEKRMRDGAEGAAVPPRWTCSSATATRWPASACATCVPYPDRNIELQAGAESSYGRRGVNILATCTPYQVGNIPVRGEHLAWMESSAVIYANSSRPAGCSAPPPSPW
jgi:predicted aconitase